MILQPYQMRAWNKTWKHHHLPKWAKDRLRAKTSLTRRVRGLEYLLLRPSLFDHWGSIEKDGLRVLVTQPYGEHNEEAAQWAKEMECTMAFFTPGPWNAGTWCYEFTPKMDRSVGQ